MGKNPRGWFQWRRPDPLARQISALLRILSIILLLILVVSKIQQIAPNANPVFWVVLALVFLAITLGAVALSKFLGRVLWFDEGQSEWLAVVLLMILVSLLFYFNRGVFWRFLQ